MRKGFTGHCPQRGPGPGYGDASDGTQAQLYRCHGYASNGAPQRWVFVQPGHDFQLALWLYDDWCIGANDFNDNSPTRLLLFGCSPSDTSQL